MTDTASGELAPNGRSIRVIEPDGSCQLFLFTNSAPVPDSYPVSQYPNTTPFSSKFDTNQLNLRNSFHWGTRQYAALSTTNVSAFATNDFLKARMKHWLIGNGNAVGQTLSVEREPSPDSTGTIEGQKTWFDYAGKPESRAEGTQANPLFVAQVLPDGNTRFTRSLRNSLGAVTNEISTYSAGGTVALRTNNFAFAANEIDLLRVTNALGVQVSSNAYNAYHQVLTNFNALGEQTVFTYNGNQQLSAVKRPSGLTTTNVYFASGDYVNWLDKTIDLEIGRTNSFTYSNGLVRTHTDARNLTLTYTWDALQRVRRVDFPDGTFVTNLFDKLDLSRVTDRLGYRSSFGYDSVRRLVAATNANGVVTRYDYCDCGSLDSVTNAWNTPVQMGTQFVYDNQGNRTHTILPDATVTNWFDALRRLSITGDGQGYRYFFYNNQGLVTNISNTLGGEQLTVYDSLDRPVYVTDANGITVTNTYDNLSRLFTRAYPDGGVEKYGYSARGLIAYTNQLDKITYHGYDEAGRLAAVTNANNEIVRYTNNAAGDLLLLTDGKTQTTRWNYDEYGRATNKLDQAGVEILRFKYDPNSRLTNRWSKAKGDTKYKYDPVGNLTNIDYAVSTDVKFQYDPLNRITNMVDAAGTTKFTYAAGGQLLTEDGPWSNDTITYGYQNRLRTSLSLQQPTGTWTNGFRYDAAWRLTNVTAQAGSFDYLYSYASPLPLKVSLPNTSYITNTYDTVARLLGTWLRKNDNTTLNTHEYSYNPGNQRTQQVFSAGSTYNYTYDPIGQLKVADSATSSEDRGYSYDAAWNLDYRTNNGVLGTFLVDGKNQLTNASYGVPPSGTMVYDSNGNMTSSDDGWLIYRYDDENRLVAAEFIEDTLIEFVYDGLGRLRLRLEYAWFDDPDDPFYDQTGIVFYIYDGGRVIQERNPSTPLVSYTRGSDLSGRLEGAGGIGGLLGRSHGYSSGNWTNHNFYHADGGGNITYLVNSSQTLAASYRYDPYGNTISATGTLWWVNQYRFSSKMIDLTFGLYYYGERWYAPTLQRWLNRDPSGEQDGANLFSFIHNSAINAIDDFGLGTIYFGPVDGRGGTLIVVPSQATQGSSSTIRDWLLPNPKQTWEQGNAAAAAAFNPDLEWYDRAAAGAAGVSIAILGVLEVTPGSGGGTKPLKRKCLTLAEEALEKGVNKAVNSELVYAAKRAVERGVFAGEKEAAEALRGLSKTITAGGRFPTGTIVDTAHLDRVLVPVGKHGYAVYQIAKNGTVRLRNVLIQRQ